ncbi:MAG: ATP-binding protein [Candidatus Symbiothrix sp.]|jgi:AAA+ ATPase superfamily predicted ATPase|nr:ATP-binding protein [Candidatus Symbiothrix sp.]
MNEIVGRKKEIELLKRIVESEEPEFVAVYGRRRVGKTFLIKQFFKNKFTFYFSGSENSTMKTQLENFKMAFQNHFNMITPRPESWTIAFEMLRKELTRTRKKGRKVIFIDEMPWLATMGSNFIQAFEYWWNTYASSNPDILLIVCGSSTSWMLNKIIKNRGGLHNRVTRQISLQPFSLKECEEYSAKQKLKLDSNQLLDYYMILGGVPYYWRQLDKSLGLPQNIDNLFFRTDAILKDEFAEIYNSLFRNSEKYILLIIVLGEKRIGLLRDEIVTFSKLPDGGAITKMLEELEQCGFIRSYYAFGKKQKNKTYQLIDLFSLFYLNFLHNKNNNNNDEQYWTNNFRTPTVNTWRGYAFEQVCLWHISQIKNKLGISGVSTTYSSWRSADENGKNTTQIDLVLNRNDNIINLCEMKYAKGEYEITKEYNDTLRIRYATFANQTKTQKTVHTTMITTFGVKQNMYWGNIQSEVKLDDLLKF